jgi:hypothetical protein
MLTLLLVMVLGCDGSDPTTPEIVADPAERLVRAAMSLAGVRPSAAELEEVRAHPESFDRLVAAYIDDPRFGENIRDMHAEQLHLRWDVTGHIPPAGPLSSRTDIEMVTAQDEQPLKLIEWVVTNGRPYSEIVTSDVVFANEITSVIYGLPFDPDGEPWQQTHWPDERPAAGVLADNAIFMRYPSSAANRNRGRGAAVAELVCDVIPERQLPNDIYEPSDTDAVTRDQLCLACHASLDPMSTPYAYARRSIQPAEVRASYAANCEGEMAFGCFPIDIWGPEHVRDEDLPAPAFYGTPVADLGELGQAVAEDPRFASCTVKRFWSWFTQTRIDEVPFEIWSPLTEQFVASGLDARQLALSIATHPDFDNLVTVRPDQYARMVEDLTGYWWSGTPDKVPDCTKGCIGEVDIARNDRYGNHTIMGGADGYFVLASTTDPSPGRHLAQAWLAEEASGFVVDNDMVALDGERRLLTGADPFDTSDAAVMAQLRHLHQRILSEDPATADVGATLALFDRVLARSGDPVVAWKMVVMGLLLDSRAVMY